MTDSWETVNSALRAQAATYLAGKKPALEFSGCVQITHGGQLVPADVFSFLCCQKTFNIVHREGGFFNSSWQSRIRNECRNHTRCVLPLREQKAEQDPTFAAEYRRSSEEFGLQLLSGFLELNHATVNR